MKNRSRYAPFVRIIGFVGLLLGSQMLASLAVALVRGRSLLASGGSFAEIDAQLLELISAHQTELLLISYGIVILVLLLLARKHHRSLSQYTGLDRKSTPALVLLGAVLGLAAAFWTSMAVALFPWPKAWVSVYEEASSVLTTASPLLDVAATVLAGPVIEELLFRGLIYEAFCAMVPAGAAAIFQGILFGGVHSSPIWMIYAGAVGCILGYVRKRTDSLRPCIAMHIVFNGSSFLFSWFAEHYGENGTAIVLAFLGSAALLLAALFAINRRTAPKAPPAE